MTLTRKTPAKPRKPMKRGKPLTRRFSLRSSVTTEMRKSRKPIARKTVVKPRNAKRKAAEFARCFHSAERVEWIKSLPCCVSGIRGDIENVHVRGDGAGRRAGFAWIVPMARELHRELHRIGIRSFEIKHDVDLYAKACNTAQAWAELAAGASQREESA